MQTIGGKTAESLTPIGPELPDWLGGFLANFALKGLFLLLILGGLLLLLRYLFGPGGPLREEGFHEIPKNGEQPGESEETDR